LACNQFLKSWFKEYRPKTNTAGNNSYHFYLSPIWSRYPSVS
jgi:hypothetical protein